MYACHIIPIVLAAFSRMNDLGIVLTREASYVSVELKANNNKQLNLLTNDEICNVSHHCEYLRHYSTYIYVLYNNHDMTSCAQT